LTTFIDTCDGIAYLCVFMIS